MKHEVESYKEINSGNINFDKIKLKILSSHSKSAWYHNDIGKELWFWNEKFINCGDLECLWLVEEGTYHVCYVHVNCTNYDFVTRVSKRKDKLIKIENAQQQD